jgi:hypothetical protein
MRGRELGGETYDGIGCKNTGDPVEYVTTSPQERMSGTGCIEVAGLET